MNKWDAATAVEDAGCTLGDALAALDLLFSSMERECPTAADKDYHAAAVCFSDRFVSVFLRAYSVIWRELVRTKRELKTVAATLYGEEPAAQKEE